ncbi:secretory immunoglobulin A-binding protein EsiB-like [Mustela lutreola]|uniref:secretory immunoglobulin A-binding protein EsiB-like n=1 Tax=Mustela lutreola TaxID=9666 RepID=UPI00279769F9|nr:secretory immunoglobulin A-binding protein EsiB-like [Mustela lutreola]
MKPLMPQRRKRRSQTSDQYGLGADLLWKYKQAPRSRSKWEILVTMGTMISLLYIWLYSQSFHFHVAHLYARFGYASAQLIVGQRYLKGAGVVKDEEMAMHWFRQASKQDHPHASFNLAVGKLKNMTGSMEVGDVEILLKVAARQGVQEAQELLENVIWTGSKLSPTRQRMRVFYKP